MSANGSTPGGISQIARNRAGDGHAISTAVPPIFFQHQQWPDSTSRSILTAAYFRFSAATIQGNRPEKQCVLLGF